MPIHMAGNRRRDFDGGLCAAWQCSVYYHPAVQSAVLAKTAGHAAAEAGKEGQFMRTLILSCNTGEGHNSCAEAIREVYAANNEVCHVKDALEFISRHASRFIAGWHTRIYRYAPKIFEAGYRGAEKKNSLFQEGTTVYRYLTSGAERLYRYILSEEYDNVICTHVFPALAITAMLEHHPMALKTSFVATDYTCSPSVEESDLGYYFIPDASLVDEFAACGIPRERLVPCGMPVKQEFYHIMEKASAKDALVILRKHQHLLMICGSMGCGPMKELAEELSLQLSPDQELTVVCGANEELFIKLQKKFDNMKLFIWRKCYEQQKTKKKSPSSGIDHYYYIAVACR